MKEFAADTGAAIAEQPDTPSEQFARLGTRLLVPSLTNRTVRPTDPALVELAESIKVHRVRQALIVRPLPAHRLQDTKLNTPKGQPLPTHEIVCGERRWLGATIAAEQDVPVIIRYLTDAEALEEQVLENIQRENFTALEEAEAFQRLMQRNKLTAEEVGKKFSKSRRHVYNRIRLLDAQPETRKALLAGEIDATRALLLAGIPDPKLQLKALEELSQKNWLGEYDYSTREAEDHIESNYMLELGKAKFSITDLTLVPEAGSCKACPKRTGHDPDLFAHIKGKDLCTDAACFHKKDEAHTAHILRQAHANGQEVITGRAAKELMPNSWGGIEGYLRLDYPADSPTDKPLRKLLGNTLEKEGVKPTLIANPHKAGEMIAVLPAGKVSELLAARGHKEAAGKVEAESKADEKAKVDKEKADAKNKYEQEWRNAVLAATWAAINKANHGGGTALSDRVLRLIAQQDAQQCSADRTRQICKLLDLGKVAPGETLKGHIDNCAQPASMILLLLMYRDVEYRSWLDQDDANKGLLLVASDFGVDIEAVKHQVRADAKAAKVKKPPIATVPLAQPVTLAKQSKLDAPAAAVAKAKPKKAKLSPEQAQLGIAEAMQGLEGKPAPAGLRPVDAWPFPTAHDKTTAPTAPLASAAGFAVGQQVKVAEALRPVMARFAGKQGRITATEGDDWIVKLDGPGGRNGGTRTFQADEIEVVA